MTHDSIAADDRLAGEAAANMAPTAGSGLDFFVVGIGASAGGIAALKTLLESLSDEPGMAFVIILHLSPAHESSAAQILQSSTRMTVTQVTCRMAIERDHVYVIPPTWDLAMDDGHLDLVRSERPRGRHVVIDRFFRTLADAHRSRSVGIVLSGTGADGSGGVARLKEQGGIVVAQAPEDAEYDAMPAAAIATGKVDFVLPVDEIGPRLLGVRDNVARKELPGSAALGLPAHDPRQPALAEASLRGIMTTLHQRTGHDFSHYKRATVLRRIERRMQVTRQPDLEAYRQFLIAQAAESKALLDDLLINVTQFFRDRGAFSALGRDHLPNTIRGLAEGEPLRAWIAGCSTGEEAYSLAMLAADELTEQKRGHLYTVFATDIDSDAIGRGRNGHYGESIAGDVAAKHLRTWFNAERGGYRVHKLLRDHVVFAEHNVLRDPPFSRVDLVSCRNLLIYLDRAAQEQVLEAFHFALKPGGLLFLGSSETVDGMSRLFQPIDKQMRIYRATATRRAPPRWAPSNHEARSPALDRLASASRVFDAAELHRQLLEGSAPPTILVSRDFEIVNASAQAARFLRYGEGQPSSNLLALMPADLRLELRLLLGRAEQTAGKAASEPLRTTVDGQAVEVAMTALAVRHASWPDGLFMISLEERPAPELPAEADEAGFGEGISPELAQAQLELRRSGAELRSTVAYYQNSSEELKASNEELQAINEELRSASEELETSKEELQSTNEELATVNNELKLKMEEVTDVNDDLRNLIAATDIATVFVDPQMRIKRFTPAASAIFNLIPGDIGRSLFDITHTLDYTELGADARIALDELRTIQREVRAPGGRRLLARLQPYRTADDKIGGAVLSFIDVSSLRRAETEADLAQQRMQAVADSMTDYAILTLDASGVVVSWNPGAEQVFGYTAAESVGRNFEMLFVPADRAAQMPARELRMADTDGRAPDDRWMQHKDGTAFFASGVTMALAADGARGYAKICRDMTSAHNEEQAQREQLGVAQRNEAIATMESALRSEFLAVMSHELKHPLNLISVNAQLLATLPEAQKLPQVARAARTIQRTVMNQGRIIDDLLDMSRLHTGKLALNRAPVLLVEAIQSAVNWALSESRNRGIRFYAQGLDEALMVDGDPVRIEQIAWNLLSNALKFTPAGGRITTRLSVDANEAVLEVADTGKGLAAEFLPRMFEMFQQADFGTMRGEGGLGIGLALVKNLAELHGGSVEALSPGLGRGTTFRVRLPLHVHSDLSPLSGVAPPAVPATVSPSAATRLLVVDDSRDALDTFEMLLELAGFRVATASSGAQALERLEAEEFDLLVSDVGMPVMDGYALLRAVRAGQRSADIPAIALTGFGREEDRRRAFAGGFQAHVDKPVDVEHLKEVIDAVLAKALPPMARKD